MSEVTSSVVHAPEPLFHVVEAVRCAIGDRWTIEGLFSVEADALAKIAALDADPVFIRGSAIKQHLPMRAVMDMLAEERLGVVGAELQKLGQVIAELRS